MEIQYSPVLGFILIIVGVLGLCGGVGTALNAPASTIFTPEILRGPTPMQVAGLRSFLLVVFGFGGGFLILAGLVQLAAPKR